MFPEFFANPKRERAKSYLGSNALDKMRMITDLFLARLAEVEGSAFSPDLRHLAQMRLLDYLGVALAGAKVGGDRVSKLIAAAVTEGGAIPAIGTGRLCDPLTAALVNGISAHWVELDDGHRYGMIHPGAPVFSALISAAWGRSLSWQRFSNAIIVGYEGSIFLARAVQPSLRNRGYHATGVCGTVGAALAVGSLWGFDKPTLRAALAASVTCASGVLKVIRGHSELKPFNAGQAALNGLIAARMAAAGYRGPDDILGGEDGFVQLFDAEEERARNLFCSDEPAAITGVYTKPYAACRHCHAPIEATLQLRGGRGLTAADIKSIEVRTHKLGARLHDHNIIQGQTSARMSIPYSVGVALSTGRAGMEEFAEPYLSSAEILGLMSKVSVTVDPEMTAAVPRRRPAEVRLKTMSGECMKLRVDLPKGEPENPVSETELVEKFVSLATFAGKTPEAAGSLTKRLLVPNPDWEGVLTT